MATKRFHRYFPTKGYDLYWILFAYLAIGYFYPVIGLLALICMIAPVAGGIRRQPWQMVVWQRMSERKHV